MTTPAASVDRAKLCAWLKDKARDENETADHKADDPRYNVFDVLAHRDRAHVLYAVAAAVQSGEPDEFVPPDLGAPTRKSGEHRIDLPGGNPADPTPLGRPTRRE